MTLPFSQLGNNTPPKLIFELFSENGDIVCDRVPLEFKNLSIELNRDIDLAGVFVEFKIDILTFTGRTERTLLKSLNDEKGVLAICNLRVSYQNASKIYVPFANDFKLDFDFYKEVTVSRTRNGIRIKTKLTGFLKKIKDRKKVKVDLTKLNSLGGYSIALIDHWSPANFKGNLNIPNIIVDNNALFDNFDISGVLASDVVTNFSVPFTVNGSDYNETQNPGVFIDGNIYDHPFFGESERDRTLIMSAGKIVVKFPIATANATITFRKATIDTDGTSLINQSSLGAITFTSGVTKTISFGDTTNLLEGQQVVIWGTINLVSGDFTFTFGLNSDPVSNTFKLRDEEINLPAVTVDSFGAYETAERCFQHVLDVQYPMKSDFLGRLDIVKNADGDFYSSEDQERFANVLNGLSVRGLALSNINNSFAISLDEIIQCYNALWNMGLGYDLINNEPRMIFEDRAFFYEDSVGTDFTTGGLANRFNDLEIQLETLPDLVYAQIETGYKSFLYEIINGRSEYNTKSEFTSIIPGSNKFNNVSPIRGDTRGFTNLMENKISANGTTDVKGDKDNFIIKSQRNGSSWDVETDENITIVDNTSIFGINSFNLFFTPLRNLLRHGYELASGLSSELNSFLRFQTSDKLQNLQTTDGVTSITENQDVLIDDLETAKWKPSQYIVKCPFYEDEMTTLISNKHKLVKLTDTKQGWILKANYNIYNNEIELRILQKFN